VITIRAEALAVARRIDARVNVLIVSCANAAVMSKAANSAFQEDW